MASSLVNLRPYQKQAIADVRAALERSGSVVLQMPTGSGKTHTAAEFIRQEATKGPVWFICHRREIIRQASKAFSALGISHDVIAPKPEDMGLGFGYSPGARVKIASVQTLSRRLSDHEAPRLVVWDECHHAAAGSWARIKDELSSAIHVGLTATPERLDGKGLSQWFSELVCGPSIQALIEAEPPALSRIRIFAPTQPDLTKARIQMGDYRKDDADKIMNTPVIIGDAVSEYRRHADGSRALVFATSVEASKNIADRFNAEGIPAAHVDGTTPLGDRDTAIADLGAGRIKVLTNVEVFTEGVDVPEVDTVILLRPTRSLALYLQMVGRGMRPAEGKERLTLLDHAGLVHEPGLGLPYEHFDWSLDGDAKKRRYMAQREYGSGPRKCPKCSYVPETREPVCSECGYEYPSGREVGEWDGQLSEITGICPAGCESAWKFRIRTRIHTETIQKLVDRGMPVIEGYIVIDDALDWLDSHKIPHQGRPLPKGNIPAEEFAAMFSVKTAVVLSWARRGMPFHGVTKSIPETEAKEWVRGHVKTHKLPPLNVERPEEYEQQKKFARRFGLSGTAIERRVRRGLPSADNGWIHIEKGLAWMRAHEMSPLLPPQDVANPDAYTDVKSFASLVGVHESTAGRMRHREGFPCASNGWVHIRKGLEWVRDNTNIAIPPEAWPKDDGGDDA